MSLKIIRPGILDTIQDRGRYGFQHLGINPGGAMDRCSAQAANILVGNHCDEAVIEVHFPASTFLFEQEAMIAVTGGNFSPAVNGEPIALCQPLLLAKNSILQFQKWNDGARSYLAIREKLKIEKWLNSYSTNIKAACGGFNGRPFQKDDVIPFRGNNVYGRYLADRDFVTLPWRADTAWNEAWANRVAFVAGNEWNWLTEDSKQQFLGESFMIGSLADRMGYRLQASLQAKINDELVSSAVCAGTIQLLPNGELIILMADHQTIGGYPRVGHVVSAHLPIVAQKQPGDKIYFQLTDQQTAEDLFFQQQQHLLQLQNACKFRLEEFFNVKD